MVHCSHPIAGGQKTITCLFVAFRSASSHLSSASGMLASVHSKVLSGRTATPSAREASIQHHEVESASVKRVVRLLLAQPLLETLPFLSVSTAVVAQDVMAILANSRELSIPTGLEVTLLKLHRVSGVDQVSEFHKEGGVTLLELGGCLFKLGLGLSVVPCADRRLVSVVASPSRALHEGAPTPHRRTLLLGFRSRRG